MDNTCMIIKKKEYEDMQKELQELRKKDESDIIISFYDRRYRGTRYNFDCDFKDSVSLSQNIKNQIRRIVLKIYKGQEEYANELIDSKLKELQSVFDSLPWYKKLNFKFKQINND